jgi:hypothetical protein
MIGARKFADGGLGANNPVDEVVKHRTSGALKREI